MAVFRQAGWRRGTLEGCQKCRGSWRSRSFVQSPSLVCLLYCCGCRLELASWSEKSYKNPGDSHSHPLQGSLTLFGNVATAFITQDILVCTDKLDVQPIPFLSQPGEAGS